MKLKEAMTADVKCVGKTATLTDAARLMKSANVGLLPVIESGRAIGVVTDRDLAIRGIAMDCDPHTTRVESVMTPEVVQLEEDQEVDAALELMEREKIGRVLVRDARGQLVGVLSWSDAAILLKGDQRIGKLVQQISQRTHPLPAHPIP